MIWNSQSEITICLSCVDHIIFFPHHEIWMHCLRNICFIHNLLGFPRTTTACALPSLSHIPLCSVFFQFSISSHIINHLVFPGSSFVPGLSMLAVKPSSYLMNQSGEVFFLAPSPSPEQLAFSRCIPGTSFSKGRNLAQPLHII